MKLTTKGTYGLKAAFELARAYGESPVPLKDIAQSQELAEKYRSNRPRRLRRIYIIGASKPHYGKPGADRPGGRYDNSRMPERQKVQK